MKIEQILPLLDQVRLLKEPLLLDIISQLHAEEHPQKLHALLICQAEHENITQAFTALNLLWPSIMEQKAFNELRVWDTKEGLYTLDLSYKHPAFIDKILVHYAALLDMACSQIIGGASFSHKKVHPVSRVLEGIGMEMLAAINLVPNEELAVKHFQQFLLRYAGQHMVAQLNAGEMVREGFKDVAKKSHDNEFFIARALAYLRVVKELLAGSVATFVQTRAQEEMLGHISRVLAIELARRLPVQGILDLFIPEQVAA